MDKNAIFIALSKHFIYNKINIVSINVAQERFVVENAEVIKEIFNKPGVARAVLQTPL